MGDGTGELFEGETVCSVDSDDKAAGGMDGRGRTGRCEGRGYLCEDSDFAKGGNREDHCFQRFGLGVNVHRVGVAILNGSEGEWGGGVMLGIVWPRWRAHGYR